MKTVKLISILGIAAMTIVLVNGFLNGDFLTDGGALLSNPWGVVSIVDLYTGFILFAVWIVYREKSLLRSILWILFLLIFGFFTASIYMLVAAINSNNSWKQFWMGEA